MDIDELWIAELRQLELPVPIWGPHHNDVDLDTFDPVDAVHSRALDRHLAIDRHAERGEKSDSGCKVVDDDADVVQFEIFLYDWWPIRDERQLYERLSVMPVRVTLNTANSARQL